MKKKKKKQNNVWRGESACGVEKEKKMENNEISFIQQGTWYISKRREAKQNKSASKKATALLVRI